MRRYTVALLALCALLLAAAGLLFPDARHYIRTLIRPDPPPRITPLALAAPIVTPRLAARPSPPPQLPTVTAARASAPTPTAPTVTPTPIPTPTIRPSPTPVEVNGRVYDAYIPAATKDHQAYKYSCEFDAAWVILQTYGFDVDVDDLIETVGLDRSIEPYIEETDKGFVIHGGDITTWFSGDYTKNFLARSSGEAMRKAFEGYGLQVTPVHEREAVEAALRSGMLVWMKTTVDFNVWRPATWVMPDGRTRQTVLGNDHAVVVIGFNADVAVIRDVLGPTSSNWQRPYEYEVDWSAFLAAWEAQEFDGLAVAPPQSD
jgi:hypothetical protein